MVFRDGRRPLIVGHRGGRGPGWPPENSMAAFVRAAREGAHAIELDVRASKDGAIAVLHDTDLSRVTGGEDARQAAALTAYELRQVRLGETGERPPLLHEVLDWAAHEGIGVNVEVKHDVPERRTVARGVAKAVRDSSCEVEISSFDPVSLAMLAVLAPKAPLALLTHTEQGLYADILRELAPPRALFGVHIERTQAFPKRVVSYLERGLFVGVWTVNSPEEALALARVGVHAIITDQPGIIRNALDDYRPSVRR